jgi:hypothetical protein
MVKKGQHADGASVGRQTQPAAVTHISASKQTRESNLPNMQYGRLVAHSFSRMSAGLSTSTLDHINSRGMVLEQHIFPRRVQS